MKMIMHGRSILAASVMLATAFSLGSLPTNAVQAQEKTETKDSDGKAKESAEQSKVQLENAAEALVESEVVIAIEKALPKDMPESIRLRIMDAVQKSDGALGDKNIEIRINSDLDGLAKDGTAKVRTFKFGKGVILGPDGKMSEFKFEGPDGKGLENLAPEIRDRFRAVLTQGTGKKEGVVVPGTRTIKLAGSRHGKIVVVGADGKMQTYAFGEGEENADLKGVLAKLPAELANKIRRGPMKVDVEVVERQKAGNPGGSRTGGPLSRLEKKLDAILSRLDQLESDVHELKDK